MTTPNQPFLFKIIYWVSIFAICFWVLTPILGLFVSLEFTSNEIENAYETTRFYGLPFAILLTLTGTIKDPDTSNSNGQKILLTLLIAGISFFIMIITLFSGMCSWTTDKVFFEDKKNSSIKIVERDYGCGATDSGKPIYKTFKVHEVTKYLIWVTEIDTNKIDMSEWTRVDKTE
jgi:uncharacterized membrane protein